MSYKTILVHVDQSQHAPARMRYAAALAHAHDARLVGAAMFGVSRDVFPHGYNAEPGTLCAEVFQPLADHARRALADFEAIAIQARAEYETRFVCDAFDEGLALLARFADLVVIGQDDPDESLPAMGTRLPEFVILNAARPVLVVPHTDPPPPEDPDILLAWDGSREAAAAMSAALPWLERAGRVSVALLTGAGIAGIADSGARDPRADKADLLGFLARHDVTPEFVVRPARHDSGRQLLDLAFDLGCGLLVMGCYGHSRFRELCLGGASRTVLAEAGIPLLLAH